MHVLVAHSRPKGKYGYYVFTAMIFFSKQTESAQIWATRLSTTYSCHHCGKWASIGTYEAPRLSDHRKIGTLELYRYDNVEPDDYIQLVLIDSELAYIQRTDFKIGLEKIKEYTKLHKQSEIPRIKGIKGRLYEVILIDWDAYMHDLISTNRQMHVEEELIQKTMNAEPITIKELTLEPVRQVPTIEGEKRFIEGEFRYLTD